MAKKNKKTKGSLFAKVKKTLKPSAEEVVAEEEATEEVIEEVVAEPKAKKTTAKKKNIVKLGGKDIDVDALTPREVRKLVGEWGRSKLKSLGII